VVIGGHSGGDRPSVTVTDSDGGFKFPALAQPYTLTFRHISYKEQAISGLESNSGDQGDITLYAASTDIDEIVVRGQRPIVKVEAGKLVYDGLAITEGKVVNNVFEAIAQMPGIIESGDDLTLIGSSGGTTIIMNGHSSVMSQTQIIDLLKATPIERLDRVETTYNAPPNWHTVGAAINVILKQDPNQLNGQLSTAYSNRRVDSYSESGNLST
jgi:hypothetical protein